MRIASRVVNPLDGIAAEPQYLDIFVPAGRRKVFKIDTYRRAFAYIFEGKGTFRDASRPRGVLLEKEVAGEEVNIRDMSGDRTLVQFGAGDEVTVTAGPQRTASSRAWYWRRPMAPTLRLMASPMAATGMALKAWTTSALGPAARGWMR